LPTEDLGEDAEGHREIKLRGSPVVLMYISKAKLAGQVLLFSAFYGHFDFQSGTLLNASKKDIFKIKTGPYRFYTSENPDYFHPSGKKSDVFAFFS
jgi:hypothetical protein